MMLENLYGWVNMSHLGVIQYVCNMAAYSDTKALTRRYPNNSFLSWLLSSLSLGGCFLRNLNIADLLYILIYHFLSCKNETTHRWCYATQRSKNRYTIVAICIQVSIRDYDLYGYEK